MSWFVYILRCADETLYTGVTTDLTRRVAEHNSGVKGKGAKYTAARQPVVLVYDEACLDRSAAQIREAALRRSTRGEKLAMIQAAATKKLPRTRVSG